ncbi:MAG: hypothetical protein HC896_13660 [Bacteroidales bacterium]|nr:hypothetical protein [Bacteroidales bacterium]
MRYNVSSGFGGLPPVVKNLLIINVLMLLAQNVLPRLGIDLNENLALYYFKSEHFMPHQFVTHMFMHGGFMHLFLTCLPCTCLARYWKAFGAQKGF